MTFDPLNTQRKTMRSFGKMEDIQENSLLDPGTYIMRALKVELKTSQQNPSCEMINVQFEVTEGPKAKAQLFQNYIVSHSNTKAVEIQLGRLKSFLKATGDNQQGELTLERVQSTIGKPFSALVKIDGDFNEINRYSPLAAPTAFGGQGGLPGDSLASS